MTGFDALLAETFRCGLVYEFWPAERAEAKKLVVVLHGRGDTIEGFHWLPEALAIEDFNYLFLQAPETYYQGFSWYEVPPHQGPGIVRSRRLLFDLLDGLQTECGLKSEDLFLFGFSQGCLMSVDVALRYPRRLGGVVGVSGYVFFEEEYPAALSACAREQRIWMSHGRQDDVLSLERTRVSVERLRGMGLNIEWTEYDKTHTVDEREEMNHIRMFLRRQLDAC